MTSQDRVQETALSPTPSTPGQVTGTNSEPAMRKRRRRRVLPLWLRRYWRVVAVVVPLLVLLPIVITAMLTFDSVVRVQESIRGLQSTLSILVRRTPTELTSADFERLRFNIVSTGLNFQNATNQTHYLRWVLQSRADATSLFTALDAATLTVWGASNMIEGLQPMVAVMSQGSTSTPVMAGLESGDQLVNLLGAGKSRFETADHLLQQAEQQLSQIDLGALPPDILLYVEQLIEYHEQMRQINQVLLNAPELVAEVFGLDETKTYLVLSQNSDEIRPSGGYISTWGTLQMRRFQIVDYMYSASDRLSPNPPPFSMGDELPIPPWWLQFPTKVYTAWDGSWYADFQETAKMSEWYYNNGENPHHPIDGVIAIDLYGFEILLRALGEVQVPGYDTPITAQNFRQAVYFIRSAEDFEGHKRFVADMYREIFSHWRELSGERGAALMQAVIQAMEAKHIMVYFPDPKLNDVVRMLGWGGEQTLPPNTDYVLAADANMGNKSNRSVVRSLAYEVSIGQDDTLSSRLSISYDYSAERAAQDPAVRPDHYGDNINYENLLQVFVPKGSQILETEDLETSLILHDTDDYTAFVTLHTVEFDSTTRLRFRYTSPATIERFGPYKRYRLLIQKQPGSAAETVSVRVALPEGARLVRTTPGVSARYDLRQTLLEFEVSLDTDRWIVVTWQ
jgi:hypothetical protein